MKRFLFSLLSLVGIALAACSALTGSEAAQCHADSDCAKRGFSGWVCDMQAAVCIEDPEGQGGNAGSSGNASGGSQTKAGDSGGGTPAMGGMSGAGNGGKA